MRLISLTCLTLAAASTAALAAIPVVDVYSLPTSDRAQINKLEQQFFDEYQRSGAVGAVVRQYEGLGKADQIGPELRAEIAKIDQCGKLSTVERIKSESSGSFVVRDHFAVIQGGCLLQLDLTYINASKGWEFNQFNIVTYSSDSWKF